MTGSCAKCEFHIVTLVPKKYYKILTENVTKKKKLR